MVQVKSIKAQCNLTDHVIDRLHEIHTDVMLGQLLSKLNKYSWISVDIMHV